MWTCMLEYFNTAVRSEIQENTIFGDTRLYATHEIALPYPHHLSVTI